MSDALKITHLSKSYGKTWALQDCTLALPDGRVAALVGPNGAGKTTTILIICGLLSRDAGEVRIVQQSISPTSPEGRQNIGLVPQDIALYGQLSGRENLLFFGKLHGLRGRELNARAEEVLKMVGLTERADGRVDRYSGGMKRRLNLAVGLLHRPRLLVMDEPTIGVDPQSRHSIMASLRTLADKGVAILYTTHYMEEVERLCDRIGILDQGRLLAEGSRRQLVALIGGQDRIRLVSSNGRRLFEACQEIQGLSGALVDENTVEVLVPDFRRVLPRILLSAESMCVTIDGIDVVEPDLEAVFLHLTGKALRD